MFEGIAIALFTIQTGLLYKITREIGGIISTETDHERRITNLEKRG